MVSLLQFTKYAAVTRPPLNDMMGDDITERLIQVPFYTARMEIARENIIEHEAQKLEQLVNSSASLKKENPPDSTSNDSHARSSQLQVEAESEITKSLKDPCDESDHKNLHRHTNEVLTTSTKSKQSTLNFATRPTNQTCLVLSCL